MSNSYQDLKPGENKYTRRDGKVVEKETIFKDGTRPPKPIIKLVTALGYTYICPRCDEEFASTDTVLYETPCPNCGPHQEDQEEPANAPATDPDEDTGFFNDEPTITFRTAQNAAPCVGDYAIYSDEKFSKKFVGKIRSLTRDAEGNVEFVLFWLNLDVENAFSYTAEEFSKVFSKAKPTDGYSIKTGYYVEDAFKDYDGNYSVMELKTSEDDTIKRCVDVFMHWLPAYRLEP